MNFTKYPLKQVVTLSEIMSFVWEHWCHRVLV